MLSVLDNGVDPAQYQVASRRRQASTSSGCARARTTRSSGSPRLYSTKSSATRAIASCVRAVTSYLDKVHQSSARAHVALGQDADGKFRFNVVAKNGTVVLTSHAYASEASAWNGAFAIQEAAALTSAYKVVESTAQDAGGFYFTADRAQRRRGRDEPDVRDP